MGVVKPCDIVNTLSKLSFAYELVFVYSSINKLATTKLDFHEDTRRTVGLVKDNTY